LITPLSGRNDGGVFPRPGAVDLEAEHYTCAVSTEGISWQTLADFGNAESGVTPFPVTARSRTLSDSSPRLEYLLHTTSTGEATIEISVAPTLAFKTVSGCRASGAKSILACID
jgi:hypothetical protein